MMKIETDISSLSKEQREALAGFIITFPTLSEPLIAHLPAGTEIPKQTGGKLELVEQPNPAEAFGGQQENANPPQFDATGLPWDERIHANSKALTADGLWRKRRGATDAEIATVEAELRKLMAAPVPVVPPPPPTPVPAVPDAAVTIPAPPPPPAEMSDEDKQEFIRFIGKISALVQGNKIGSPEVTAICMKFQVPNAAKLKDRPDLIPFVEAEIDALVASK